MFLGDKLYYLQNYINNFTKSNSENYGLNYVIKCFS